MSLSFPPGRHRNSLWACQWRTAKGDQHASMSITITTTKNSLQNNSITLSLVTEVSKPRGQKLLWFTLYVALPNNISLQEKVTHLRDWLVLSEEFSGRSIRFLELWVSCKEGDPTHTVLNLASSSSYLHFQSCELAKPRWSQQGLTYPGTTSPA